MRVLLISLIVLMNVACGADDSNQTTEFNQQVSDDCNVQFTQLSRDASSFCGCIASHKDAQGREFIDFAEYITRGFISEAPQRYKEFTSCFIKK